MIETVLLIMVSAPAIAALIASVIEHPRVVEMVNLLAALIVFACALSLPFIVGGSTVLLYGYVGIEPLSAWVLLCTGIVYLLASIYAVGYMRMLDEPDRLPRFYMLFATFALPMLAAGNDSAVRGLRRAVTGMALFIAVYVVLVVVTNR